MEKSLIHSNELHFISKKRIHQAVEKMVESLDLAAGSTTGFNIYAVVESYFTDLEKRREINRLLNLEQDVCEEINKLQSYKLRATNGSGVFRIWLSSEMIRRTALSTLS